MKSRLKQFLNKLSIMRSQGIYAPESNREEDLRSFQDEIDEIQQLADNGMVRIIGDPHQESITGKRYIDRIRVEVTTEGIKWLAREDTMATSESTSSTRAQFVDEQIAKLKKDFGREVLLPLRSDLRAQGMKAYELWKRDFIIFLEQQMPHDVNRFRRLISHADTSNQATKENAYNRFMREEGKICLDFLQSVAQKSTRPDLRPESSSATHEKMRQQLSVCTRN